MSVFIDTSALYATLDEEDVHHDRVAQTFRSLVDGVLLTHSYVVAESAALIKRRLGKLHARRLITHLFSPIEVVWTSRLTTPHRAHTSRRRHAGAVTGRLHELRGDAYARDHRRPSHWIVTADAGFELIP